MNKDNFLLDMIKYNFVTRFKDKTLFRNVSRLYIRNRFLTSGSKIDTNINKSNHRMLMEIYNNAVSYTLDYLKSFDNVCELISIFESDSIPEVLFCNDQYDKNIIEKQLTLSDMLNSIFSKGFNRFIYFYNFVDGLTIDQLPIDGWDELTDINKNYFAMNFIISNQIFGDGNHRTSRFIHRYYNLNLTNNILDSIIDQIIRSNEIREDKLYFPYEFEICIRNKKNRNFYKQWGNYIVKQIN